MKKDVTCSRHGTVSVLCALLWREQESVTAALQVSVPFAKEMCRMLCAQQGDTTAVFYPAVPCHTVLCCAMLCIMMVKFLCFADPINDAFPV